MRVVAAKNLLPFPSNSFIINELDVEPTLGFEPRTDGLQNRCSTTELSRRWVNHTVGRGGLKLKYRGICLRRDRSAGQGGTMKIGEGFASGRQLAVGMVVALLAGCAGDPAWEATRATTESSFGAGYPTGSAAWSHGARAAYRTAFMAGMQDRREGFRYEDDRGALRLDREQQGFYRQGYRRGYYHVRAVRRSESHADADAETQEEPGPDDQ